MKKVLALVLVAVMVLSSVAFATPKEEKVQDPKLKDFSDEVVINPIKVNDEGKVKVALVFPKKGSELEQVLITRKNTIDFVDKKPAKIKFDENTESYIVTFWYSPTNTGFTYEIIMTAGNSPVSFVAEGASN